jgi:hypothetical protein
MAIETTSDLSLVGTSQIVDGSVTSAKIGTGAVGSAALASGAVVAAAIAAGAVGSATLADNAVVAAKISAGSVGTVAISSGSATSGQILQANGSGAVTFETPAAGGGLTLIATATPSAASSLSFTSIPGTYKHLQLVWLDVFQSVTSPWWGIRFNNDSTSGQYFARQRGVSTSNSTATMIGTTNQNAPIGATTTSSTVYNSQSKGTLDIFLYTESQNKFFRMVSINDPTDGVAEWTGVYIGTAAVTSLDFVRSSTQTITGKFYLYGVS